MESLRIRNLLNDDMNLCRICLTEPKSNSNMKFFNIFSSTGPDEGLSRVISELLCVKVERHDIKPKIICDCCYKLLFNWSDMKNKAKESQIIIDYVVAKKKLPINMNSTSDLPLDFTVENRSPSTAFTADDAVRENSLEDVTSSDSPDVIILDSEDSLDDVILNNEESVKTTELASPVAVVPVTVATNERVIADRRNAKSMRLYAHLVHTSSLMLFTCIKPYCNIISSSFKSFKSHCRSHLNIKHSFTCWECIASFSSINELQLHQAQANCQKPGMFKCFECSTFYDNIQILSVHKLTAHECTIMAKNKMTLPCPFCKLERNTKTFQNHLINCRKERDSYVVYGSSKKPDPYAATATTAIATTAAGAAKSKLITSKRKLPSYKCIHCQKLCSTKGALTNHLKKHKNEAAKKALNANQTNKIIGRSANDKLTIPTTAGDYSAPGSSAGTGVVDSQSMDFVDDSLRLDDNRPATVVASDVEKWLPPPPPALPIPLNENQEPAICMILGAPFSLSEQWPGCSVGVGVTWANSQKKLSPANYYCSVCKEYFTYAGFGEHWKIIHGQQLRSKRYRRFKCDQCPSMFVYKIARDMHREHEHGEKQTVIETPVVAESTVECVDAFITIDEVQMTQMAVVTATTAAAAASSADNDESFLSAENLTDFTFRSDEQQFNISYTGDDNDAGEYYVGDRPEEICEFGSYANDGMSGIVENIEDDTAGVFVDQELWKTNMGAEQNQPGNSDELVLLDELDLYVSKIANEMVTDNNATTSSNISDDSQNTNIVG